MSKLEEAKRWARAKEGLRERWESLPYRACPMRFSMHRKEWMRASRRVHCGSAGGCTVRVFVYAAATGVYDDVKIIVPNDARVVVVTKF
eukprot:CAMPEP_0119521364 /NCGR_PEP_ID=MMETSP1344-20130328/37080_1 /TAXON_ID=236787 /ORGANISM="Florenciella parvula, Strain CCMP2471" /LENGTH=88 /DNA_ID=CAMNT_0007559325 /DNA_START=483 /DNA_END=746 /DNA_ORIENTATION=+